MIFKIHKQLIQLNILKNPNNTVKNNGQKNRIDIFSKEQQMANRPVKSCSRLLTTTEMQIKTTKWYHLTPTYLMAIIKKTTDNRCWQRCGQKGTQEHCWGERQREKPLWKTVWKCLKKLKIELPYGPVIALLQILQKTKTKILIWKYLYTPIFIAASFTIAKIWNQPKYILTD